MAASNFNINPLPWEGLQNPFGMIPGAIGAINPTAANFTSIGAPSQIGMPNPFADLSAVFNDLPGANNAAIALTRSQMEGELSPQVLKNLQNQNATNSQISGMPGSNVIRGTLGSNNALLGNIRTSEALQQQGLTNYQNLLRSISSTQTVSPETQANIGQFNAGAQNQVNAQNAGFANQFALANQSNQQNYDFANLGTARYNAENSARANPEAEFNKQFELWKLGQTLSGGGGGGGSPAYNSYTGPALSSPVASGMFGRDSSGRGFGFDPGYNPPPVNGGVGTLPASLNLNPWDANQGYGKFMSGGFTSPNLGTNFDFLNPDYDWTQPNEQFLSPIQPQETYSSEDLINLQGGWDPWQEYIDATGG